MMPKGGGFSTLLWITQRTVQAEGMGHTLPTLAHLAVSKVRPKKSAALLPFPPRADLIARRAPPYTRERRFRPPSGQARESPVIRPTGALQGAEDDRAREAAG